MMKKRLFCIVLTLCLLLSCLPAAVFAAEGGQCGYEVTWSFSESSGRLTISGQYGMYDQMEFWGWEGFAEKITSVKISSGVTSIGAYAFAYLPNLTYVSLPSSMESIGAYAFAGCEKLESIYLPEKLRYIGDYAFADCTSLESISLPAKLQYLGGLPFAGCTSLQKIKASSDSEWLSTDSRGVLMDKDKTVLYMAPGGLSSSYTVPSTVKTIYPYAFMGCEKLKDVHLGYAVESVSPGAFAGCTQLKGVWAHESSKFFASDSKGALYNKGMTTLYFVPYITTGHYTVRQGVTKIEQAALFGCANITGVTLPDSLQWIAAEAFSASGLTQITVPASVNVVDDYAFAYCVALTKAEFSANVVSMGTHVFDSCISLESVQLPACSITSYMFYGCLSLADLKLGTDYMTEIGYSAFYGCISLPHFTFPDGLVFIRSHAFYGCMSLTDLDLNDVISLDDCAFAYCVNLRSLRFNPPVHDVSFNSRVFEGCENLRELYFECGISNVADNAFNTVTATAHYPTNLYHSWNETQLKDYGGSITWVPYTYVCQEHWWKPGHSEITDGVIAYRIDCSMCKAYKKEYRTWGFGELTSQRSGEGVLEHMLLLVDKTANSGETYVFPEAVTDISDPQTAPKLYISLPEGISTTLTIPVDTEADNLNVYQVYDNGGFKQLENALVTEEGVVVTLDSSCTLLICEGQYHAFRDIVKGKYYYDAVLWAVNNGITKGTSNTTFSPDGACTRKQIVTFLWRAAGEPEPESTENPFTDVTRGDQFEKAILWAYENGITNGTSETTFSPDRPCTRKQIVTFLWRAAGEPEPESTENPFTDVTRGDQFEKAILWAYENGITTGVTATEFRPEEPCTRGHIVTFLYRFMAE